MKHILRDGFLTSNPHLLQERTKGFKPLHRDMICFTTSKWRHLSNFSAFTMFLGYVGMDTYLKIPFEVLKAFGVKPIIYEVTVHDLEDIAEASQYYYLATLTHRKDKLIEKYGDDFSDYLYRQWFLENEWRLKADRLELPERTEVYVTSYYQRRVARRLTNLPVKIDRELMRFKTLKDIPNRIKRKLRRILGKQLYYSARFVAIRKVEGKLRADFYDCPEVEGRKMIKILQEREFKCYTWGYPWKYRPCADIFVDLPQPQFTYAYQNIKN